MAPRRARRATQTTRPTLARKSPRFPLLGAGNAPSRANTRGGDWGQFRPSAAPNGGSLLATNEKDIMSSNGYREVGPYGSTGPYASRAMAIEDIMALPMGGGVVKRPKGAPRRPKRTWDELARQYTRKADRIEEIDDRLRRECERKERLRNAALMKVRNKAFKAEIRANGGHIGRNGQEKRKGSHPKGVVPPHLAAYQFQKRPEGAPKQARPKKGELFWLTPEQKAAAIRRVAEIKAAKKK